MTLLARRLLLLVGLIAAGHDCCLLSQRKFDGARHVAALILARGGSKGIPLKNLAPVGGTSLLKISLLEALAVGFDSVWVSTENLQILAEAASLTGVNVHWRSAENATDEATSVAAVREFLSGRPEVDAVALIQCTSPFQNRKYLAQALHLIRAESSSCVFSVTASPWKLWERAGSRVRAVNFDPGNRKRRQSEEAPNYRENGMFYFSTRALVESGFLQSDR